MNKYESVRNIEVEQKPLSVAVVFSGQGVTGEEICSYYQILSHIEPEITKNYIDLVQESIHKAHGGNGFDFYSDLENPSSPSFLRTDVIQSLGFGLNLAAYRILQEKSNGKLQVNAIAGHSAGENAALVASGCTKEKPTAEAVGLRGRFMQENREENPTDLVSIFGLSEDEVLSICKKTGSFLALHNGPQLFAIGTEKERTPEVLRFAGKRATVIPNAAAYHTRHMSEAATKLAGALEGFEDFFSTPHTPVITNRKGEPTIDPRLLEQYMIENVYLPSRYAKLMETINLGGFNLVIALGAGENVFKLNRINKVPQKKNKTLEQTLLML